MNKMNKVLKISTFALSVLMIGVVSAHDGRADHLQHKKQVLKHKIKKQEHKAQKALSHGNWFGFFKHRAKAEQVKAKKQHVKRKINHVKHYA